MSFLFRKLKDLIWGLCKKDVGKEEVIDLLTPGSKKFGETLGRFVYKDEQRKKRRKGKEQTKTARQRTSKEKSGGKERSRA